MDQGTVGTKGTVKGAVGTKGKRGSDRGITGARGKRDLETRDFQAKGRICARVTRRPNYGPGRHEYGQKPHLSDFR